MTTGNILFLIQPSVNVSKTRRYRTKYLLEKYKDPSNLNYTLLFIQKSNIRKVNYTLLFFNIVPVSYTHLDVYKRQVVGIIIYKQIDTNTPNN